MFPSYDQTTLDTAYANKQAFFARQAQTWNDNLAFNWRAYFYSTFLVELMAGLMVTSWLRASLPTLSGASTAIINAC